MMPKMRFVTSVALMAAATLGTAQAAALRGLSAKMIEFPYKSMYEYGAAYLADLYPNDCSENHDHYLFEWGVESTGSWTNTDWHEPKTLNCANVKAASPLNKQKVSSTDDTKALITQGAVSFSPSSAPSTSKLLYQDVRVIQMLANDDSTATGGASTTITVQAETQKTTSVTLQGTLSLAESLKLTVGVPETYSESSTFSFSVSSSIGETQTASSTVKKTVSHLITADKGLACLNATTTFFQVSEQLDWSTTALFNGIYLKHEHNGDTKERYLLDGDTSSHQYYLPVSGWMEVPSVEVQDQSDYGITVDFGITGYKVRQNSDGTFYCDWTTQESIDGSIGVERLS